jgi:Sigma-70, region 4.
MENNKLVRVKLYSDRKHYSVIEVREDEVEKVYEANRMTWQELKKEERKRIKLEKEGIVVSSLESLDDDASWIPDESLNAEEQIIKEETCLENMQRLKVAISQLELRQQEMIRLVFFEGKAQDEVASLYGVTKAAISNSMQRIYAMLKKYLQNI